MKKILILSVLVIFCLVAVSSSFAAGECPQPRKTKSAPSKIARMDETATADAENGKALYLKIGPVACVNCHGAAGDGMGPDRKIMKPSPPRNFTCAETMKNVSAGQMFHIIKNGSNRTGMIAYGVSGMKDKEIWDVVKYIRSTFVK